MSKDLEIKIAQEDLENGLKDMETTIEELNKPNVDKSKEEMYVNLATKQVYMFENYISRMIM